MNLKLMEKEDLPLLQEWVNNLNIEGEYEPIKQETIKDLEKQYDDLKEGQWFFIEKKDGKKIGYVAHFVSMGKQKEIGYALLPEERGKGYGTEAVTIMVDYLFLSKDIMRIQADIRPENIASQKVLEKVGFKKEGILRKCYFSRGKLRDTAIFSILREEWKEPKIIAKGK